MTETTDDRYQVARRTFDAILYGIAGDDVEIREVRRDGDGSRVTCLEVTVPSREQAALLIGRRGNTIRGIHSVMSATMQERAPLIRVRTAEQEQNAEEPEAADASVQEAAASAN